MKASRRFSYSSPPSRQRGAVLLLLFSVLFLASLYFMVERGNEQRFRQQSNEQITEEALARAKAALLGRAVNDDNRPGSLPCPDTDGDGIAEMLSGNDCPSYVGWLPWYSLKLPELTDKAGERLWYILDENFRDDDSALINPDTPVDLELDGESAVALLFAPGIIQDSQSRPSSALADYIHPLAENLDGDAVYTRWGGSDGGPRRPGNRFLTLSREEVLLAAQRRALGEVAQALETYASTAIASGDIRGSYPWLAPFANPANDAAANSVYQGVQNTCAGLLPFFVDGQSFSSEFAISWDVANMETGVSGTVSEADLNSVVTNVSAMSFSSADCIWNGVETVECSAEVTTDYNDPPVTKRTLAVDVKFTGTASLQPPVADGFRTRTVSTADIADVEEFNVTLTEIKGGAASSGQGSENASGQGHSGVTAGTGTLSLPASGGTVNSLSVSRLPAYLLTESAGGLSAELPEWFIANQWYRYIYAAIAPAAQAGAIELITGDLCTVTSPPTSSTRCLSVEIKQSGDAEPLQSGEHFALVLLSRGLDVDTGSGFDLDDADNYFDNLPGIDCALASDEFELIKDSSDDQIKAVTW